MNKMSTAAVLCLREEDVASEAYPVCTALRGAQLSERTAGQVNMQHGHLRMLLQDRS